MTLELSWPLFVLLLLTWPLGIAFLAIAVASWVRELVQDVRAGLEEIGGRR